MLEFATSHDDGGTIEFTCLAQEYGQVLGIVLPVAIDGDGIVVAQHHRLANPPNQRVSLAPILGIVDDVDGMGIVMQELERLIGRAVVDHHDVVRIDPQAVEDRLERLGVVVGRHED